jgi:hypothetical protein
VSPSDNPRAGLSFFDGAELLRMIATALISLSHRRLPGDPVYDDQVQRAYNHVVLLCLRKGVEPPSSVPGLVRWAAERPVSTWPLDLPEEFTAAETTLINPDSLTPTQACFEWIVNARDTAAEQLENQLMGEALDACRRMKSPETYTAFRRLLIERPVLNGVELALLGGDFHLAPINDLIRRCYEPASAAYRREGHGDYTTCTRCRCLLVPTTDGRFTCELDRCRRDGTARADRRIAPDTRGGVLQLTRPLRMFITSPGLAEVELERELGALGLSVEMWPNFDAYDLRVLFPDGDTWAIDVKDRASPELLGRSATAFSPEPPHDRAMLVVPKYRFDEREDYARVFTANLPEQLSKSLPLFSDQAVVRQAKARLRRTSQKATRPEGEHRA